MPIFMLKRSLIWGGDIRQAGETIEVEDPLVEEYRQNGWIGPDPVKQHVRFNRLPVRNRIEPITAAPPPTRGIGPTIKSGVVSHVRDITDEVDLVASTGTAGPTNDAPASDTNVSHEFLVGSGSSSEVKQVKRGPGRPRRQ